MRRGAVILAGWLVAVASAGVVGMTTISALGDGLVGPGSRPLGAGEVDAQLARSARGDGGASTPGPAGSPVPTVSGSDPASDAVDQVLSVGGATVLARCEGDAVTLLSWSPPQGYHTDEWERGPADHARVQFAGADGSHEMRVSVTCVDGRPQASMAGED